MKTITKCLRGLFSTLMLLVCVACSKEEFPEKKLVGKWVLVSTCNANTGHVVESAYDEVYYQFEEDGTGKKVSMGSYNSAYVQEIEMWQVFQDKLVIKFYNDSYPDKYYIRKLTNSEMVWREEINEYNSTMATSDYEYTFEKI